MVAWLKALAYGAGGMAVVGLAALVALQERLVYVPALPGLARAYSITPSRLRLVYEDVWLRAADGVRLHSWFIRHSPTCRGPTILFFQENAGNIAHRLECVRLMMQRLQCNVFMLSYRGYGESEGYPSQSGITKDAQAALDHLVQRKDIDTSRIVIFGRSLGGAVGAILAKNNPDKESLCGQCASDWLYNNISSMKCGSVPTTRVRKTDKRIFAGLTGIQVLREAVFSKQCTEKEKCEILRGVCSSTGKYFYIYIGYGRYHAALLKMVHRWQFF